MTSSVQPKSSPSPFPLNSTKKFSWLIRVPLEELESIATTAESFYRPFSKKTGNKERTIHNPTGRLKIIQKKINTWVLQRFNFPDFMVGGVKGKKLEDHLKLHLKKEIVITLDIKDCFPSITNQAVYNAFIILGALPDTAMLATKLITYKGEVPLGAPTSTLIANIVLLPILIEIKNLVERYGFDLSQFVDDTAFSGKQLPEELISEICKLFSKSGFTISHKKIKVMPNSGSQRVTKRIVNQNPGMPRKEINRIRSAIYEFKSTPKNDPEYSKKFASVKGRIIGIKKLHPQIAERFLQQIV